MERAPVDRMDLDVLDEHGHRLLATDGQVDQRVRTDVLAELLEVMRIERHAGGVEAVSEHDRRQAAFLAEAVDGLAGDLTVRGGQRRAGGGCHLEFGPRFRTDSVGLRQWPAERPAAPEIGP